VSRQPIDGRQPSLRHRAFERTISNASDGCSYSHRPATLAKLEQAVRSLRRLDREVFLAVRLDAMSYEQIAARTGLTVKQVERRVGAYAAQAPRVHA
jgi:DNA-directed RNA polymerase specialized sigma24 family protein